jgi:hypothetical protein
MHDEGRRSPDATQCSSDYTSPAHAGPTNVSSNDALKTAAPLNAAAKTHSQLDEFRDIWPPELTRRLRVLLHTLPLDALRRGDAMREPELRHYDALALALRVLDLVIDRLGLEDEADRDVITRSLQPVLSAIDAAAGLPPSPDRHDRIIDKLLAGLRNDADARRPFREGTPSNPRSRWPPLRSSVRSRRYASARAIRGCQTLVRLSSPRDRPTMNGRVP